MLGSSQEERLSAGEGLEERGGAVEDWQAPAYPSL